MDSDLVGGLVPAELSAGLPQPGPEHEADLGPVPGRAGDVLEVGVTGVTCVHSVHCTTHLEEGVVGVVEALLAVHLQHHVVEDGEAVHGAAQALVRHHLAHREHVDGVPGPGTGGQEIVLQKGPSEGS